MKNSFSEVINCLKGTQVSKHFDSRTTLNCGKCEGEPLTMQIKGDFTVNAIQIIAVMTAITVMGIGCALARKLKD